MSPGAKTQAVEVVASETAEAFLAELLPSTGRIWEGLRAGGDHTELLFRGQRDSSWGLQPSAFRPGAFDELPAVDISSISGPLDEERAEHLHVVRFIDAADALGFHIPGDAPSLRDGRPRNRYVMSGPPRSFFPPTDFIYMYALAQHYGIPTRLLDWTYAPLAAAYFAATGTPGAMGSPQIAVWAMSKRTIVEHLGPVAWEKNTEGPMVSFVNPPQATNPNLKAQAGAFSLVHDPDRRGLTPVGTPYVPWLPRNLDDIVRTEIERFPPGGTPVLYQFILPEGELARLMRLLAEHRIHAGSMYPGLGGVVAYLKEERRYR